MRITTLMIASALILAACGGEEPIGAPEPPAPDELRFRIVEGSSEEVPHSEVPYSEVPHSTETVSTETESRTWSFTCEVCGSTMTCGEQHPSAETEIELIYESPSSADCAEGMHDWRSGISRAHAPALPDGTLVLVKRGQACGAFVLSRQTTMPERAQYRWWFRDDGGARLDAGSPTVTSGSGECDVASDPGAQITFGPFRVNWSGNMEGFGYIYYPGAPGRPVSAGAVRICVTDAKDIAGIDTADPKWVFKGSPVD